MPDNVIDLPDLEDLSVETLAFMVRELEEELHGPVVKVRRTVWSESRDIWRILNWGDSFRVRVLVFGERVYVCQAILPSYCELSDEPNPRQGYQQAVMIQGYNEYKKLPLPGELVDGEYCQATDLITETAHALNAASRYLRRSGPSWERRVPVTIQTRR